MPQSFADDVQTFAEVGCHGMEVWLTKLEKHLEQSSIAETKQLLAKRQMTLAAAAYQGGLLVSQGAARKEHFEHFKRRLELCREFDIPTLLVIADFVETIDASSVERAIVLLKEAGRLAASYGVRLALEFRSSATFCTSLDTAVALVSQCGEANIGINFDVFHFYTGPSKTEDLALLSRDNLFFVQLADLAGVPRELASDSDRVLPGEGDFRLEPIMQRLREIGYEGWVSLELMNPVLWQTKATSVAELGFSALERVVKGK
ncbi:MAG: hypothetical protein KatS3mg105_2120 [Gemmatales bacterium]|nr:MAG: hypothetical protein KatS3mg105_2120 [Gemmatales bacterium]